MMMPDVHILVVDDFAPWRQHIRSILELRTEFQIVGEASDGLEALHKAEELKPDLILLDIGLPKLNGIEAGNRLSQLVPGAKVIFVTAIGDVDVVQTAWGNGAQAYVLKVDAARELLPAIDAVLRGNKFASSGVKRSDSGKIQSWESVKPFGKVAS
jgi:DNA-binding NarL/FixJ family response regulator